MTNTNLTLTSEATRVKVDWSFSLTSEAPECGFDTGAVKLYRNGVYLTTLATSGLTGSGTYYDTAAPTNQTHTYRASIEDRSGWANSGTIFEPVCFQTSPSDYTGSNHTVEHQLDKPDLFTFNDLTQQPIDVWVMSEVITLTGGSGPFAISITGGEYAVNNQAWTAAAGTVSPGDGIQIRQRSSVNYETMTSVTLTIDSESDTWSVTTSLDPTNTLIIFPVAAPPVALYADIYAFFGGDRRTTGTVRLGEYVRGGPWIPDILYNRGEGVPSKAVPLSPTLPLNMTNICGAAVYLDWQKSLQFKRQDIHTGDSNVSGGIGWWIADSYPNDARLRFGQTDIAEYRWSVTFDHTPTSAGITWNAIYGNTWNAENRSFLIDVTAERYAQDYMAGTITLEARNPFDTTKTITTSADFFMFIGNTDGGFYDGGEPTEPV